MIERRKRLKKNNVCCGSFTSEFNAIRFVFEVSHVRNAGSLTPNIRMLNQYMGERTERFNNNNCC